MRRSPKPYIDASYDQALVDLITKKIGVKRWYSFHDVYCVLSAMVDLMTVPEDERAQ